MPQIVMRQMMEAQSLSCAVHGHLAFSDTHDRFCRGVRAVIPQSLQKHLHLVDHWHAPYFTVLGSLLRIAAHDDFFANKIAISPGDIASFAQTKPSIRQEPNQVRAIAAKSAA